jgi:hypothetical protein
MSCVAESSRFLLGIGCLTLILVAPVAAHAAVIVTEIMYNPAGANAGHQWIEITNTGPDSVDLGAKDIRLFDSSGNHVIKAYEARSDSAAGADTEAVLSAGTVAVITKDPLTFLSDYPTYAGTLLKSSFTLSSAAGFVGILQADGAVLEKATYSAALGAAGDGNSLQRLATNSSNASGTFKPAAPTPGISPITLPTALVAPMKPSVSKIGTTKGKKSSLNTSITPEKYEKGMTAAATSAETEVAAALPAFSFPEIQFPAFLTRLAFLISSVWFAGFLGLLAFSTFSLMLIERQRRLYIYS